MSGRYRRTAVGCESEIKCSLRAFRVMTRSGGSTSETLSAALDSTLANKPSFPGSAERLFPRQARDVRFRRQINQSEPIHRRRDRSRGSAQARANGNNIAQAFLGVGRHIRDGVFYLDLNEGGTGCESICSFGRLNGRICPAGIRAGPGRSRGNRSETGSGTARRSSPVGRSVCFVPTVAC